MLQIIGGALWLKLVPREKRQNARLAKIIQEIELFHLSYDIKIILRSQIWYENVKFLTYARKIVIDIIS